MSCSFGSEPLENAPDRVFLDSGVFCSVLGFTHPLCRIPDRLYFEALQALGGLSGAISGPPKVKDWAVKFARGIWGAAWEDAVDNGLQPAVFCTSPRPPEPPEITYFDLVAFLLGESDSVLEKIFDWWKFKIWGDYCRCKPSPRVAPISPQNAGPSSWPAPPPVATCGGQTIITPAGIQNAFAGLVQNAQEYLDSEIARNNLFLQQIAEIEAGPIEVFQIPDPSIGTIRYSGIVQVTRPWIFEETFPIPAGPLPPSTIIPPERTATANWSGVSIQAIWWPRGSWRKKVNQSIEIALTDLIPQNTQNQPVIPAGTVLSVGDFVVAAEIIDIAWYFRIFLQGGVCPQGSQSQYQQWKPGPDGDDPKLCEDVTPLCKVKLPGCPCDAPPWQPITIADIESLTQLLGPLTPS